MRYATIAGFDPVRLTRSQVQARELAQQNEPSTFTTGPIYKNYFVVEYEPERLMIKNSFVPAHPITFDETKLNDCLTLAVNQLVRHRLFTKREQVQKLW